MNSKRVTKAFEEVTRGLIKTAADFPSKNSTAEAEQIVSWRKYIEWEKSNPSHVTDKISIAKVVSAYDQCLELLGHNLDVWLDAALFSQRSSKLLAAKGDETAAKCYAEKTVDLFGRAAEKFNDNVLHFAYAEFEEERANFKKVHEIFQKLIALPDCDPTLVFVQYMKFARRAESVKSSREVFKKAREDVRTSYHVYVAAAFTEFYRNKDKTTAVKIFELGLKKYADNSSYILAYIDFLSHLNEDANLRALFERVLASGSLSPDQSVVIWDKFVEFESNIGDLTSVLDVERRRALHKSEGNESVSVAERFKFMNLFPSVEMKQVGGSPKSEIDASAVFTIGPVAASLLAKMSSLCFRGPFVNVGMTRDVLNQRSRCQVEAKLENEQVLSQFQNLGQLKSQFRKRTASETETEHLPDGGIYALRMKKRWKAEEGLSKPID